MTADPLRPRDRLRFPRWGQRGTTGASIPAELAFDRVSQVYGSLRALDDVSLVGRGGRARLPARPIRLRQDDAAPGRGRRREPDAGRVLLDGREVTGPKLFLPPEARGIGLMFQDYALFPHLSIIENVTFGLRGLAAARRRDRREAGALPGRARALRRRLSACALRRRAAARGAGALDRAASGRAPDGRAVLEPRPAPARRDPRRDRGDPARDRRHDHRRDARSRGGDADRRPHRADAGGAHRPGRHGRGDLPPPGRHLRGALLLRLQRGRGRRPRRAGRDAGRALCRAAGWRTAPPPSSASGRRACGSSPPASACRGASCRGASSARSSLSRSRSRASTTRCRRGCAGRFRLTRARTSGVEIDPDEVLVFAAGHP